MKEYPEKTGKKRDDRNAWQGSPDLNVDAELIIDTVPDGLMVLDQSCRILRWNRAMEQLSGYSQEEIFGNNCTALDFRDPGTGERINVERQCLLSGSSNDSSPKAIECTLRNRDGETIPVRKLTRVIRDAGGNPVGLLDILTDLRPLRKLEQELSALRRPAAVSPPGRLTGNSMPMREVYERIRLAADSDVTVLIEGETGTGKELIAEAIHQESHRRDRPLVKVNCSALSENLLESELFGHVRGSFTGAVSDKTGRIEAAEGGTLFLDEIGDVSPLIQLKLLRLLQEHEYERVGESATRRADIRIIAATHRNLKKRVAEGFFREDFYYRIHVFSIMVPPLRSRREDLPLLCEFFIRQMNKRTGKSIDCLLEDARQRLLEYCWPGNVRELENAIEHAFVTCPDHCIRLEDLPYEIRSAGRTGGECEGAYTRYGLGPGTAKKELAPELLFATLQESGWNRSEAARRLGIDRSTLWRKMKKWALEVPGNDQDKGRFN